ncbi:hypothetical protein T12_10397 [Trichinella patagoniensis]|uniref:Uncharacterized protein n=1 Tax=Trichinella patagoniensis TaxID=990121 RepID=A0A0V0ZES0_9BILA|nr:hypothetical protein T12_10397 [Trichinella patagoniensis]
MRKLFEKTIIELLKVHINVVDGAYYYICILLVIDEMQEHIWNEYFNEEEKKVCRDFGAVSLEQLLPSFAVRPWASLFHNKNESLRKSRQPSREW